MANLIRAHQSQLQTLCQQHKVAKLYAFGSVVTDDFDREKESDIDLYIEMLKGLDPLEKGEHLLTLWASFEQLFNRKVDLLTDTGVTNPYLLASIQRSRQLLYERESQ